MVERVQRVETTPPRLQPTLHALVTACIADDRIRAAWLGGSLARGIGDDWSDIDLHVLTLPGFEALTTVPGWLEVVHADEVPDVGGVFLFVTPDWVHVDVVIHHVDGFDQGSFPAQVLVDKDGAVRDVAAVEAEREPYFPGDPSLFIYFMGLLPTVVAREEWIAGARSTAMMRDRLLVALMLGENGVCKDDGAKRLNRYLTDEQRDALATIPPIGADPDQLLAAQVAIAREYLTRGRRLAAAVGRPWPDEFERVTRELWSRELGLEA